jgi:hypothetical protein
VKGRKQGGERIAAEGKARNGQWVNPDKARGRAREKVTAAKMVLSEEEKTRIKNY